MYFVTALGLLLALPSLVIANSEYARLETVYTANDVARESLDRAKYPAFYQFLDSAEVLGEERTTDPKQRDIIATDKYYVWTPETWDRFFLTAAKEKLTVVRAYSLLGKEIKKRGFVLVMRGDDFEAAVKRNNLDCGLALPAYNIGVGIWTPNTDTSKPELLASLRVLYKKEFIHRFRKEVLPAKLKVGIGDTRKYWMDGEYHTHREVKVDVFYGPNEGYGFRNIEGIGGQKLGFLGFMQKVLFFIPDGIDAIVINEESKELMIEAIINESIPDFESQPKYAVRVIED